MFTKPKVVILDLGGVLLKWDPLAARLITSEQMRSMMNTLIWHDLDRGRTTLDVACKKLGQLLGIDASVVSRSLEQAQKSLVVNWDLVKVVQRMKAAYPGLRLYIMSNISKEHYDVVHNLDIPWSIFSQIFISAEAAMRKPDLCFFRHVLEKIDADPGEILMVDDKPDNICAARSLGIRGMLVGREAAPVAQRLWSIFSDRLSSAEAYMNAHAGSHFSVIQGQHAPLKDNFSQLLIWQISGRADWVQLRWPPAGLDGASAGAAPHSNGHHDGFSNQARRGLWNYFSDPTDPMAKGFPADADTNSVAYLCVPESRLGELADVNTVMDMMLANRDSDGIMQTYFDKGRPRSCPEVGCNILRLFYRFGRGADPGIQTTQDWVVQCLDRRACANGSRFYSTPEPFLYFTACLYRECNSETLRCRLAALKEALLERVNVPTNPLALALRIAACELAGISPQVYEEDFLRLLSQQEEDGGWPAGHFCWTGRTGARVGSRGLTTALAIKLIQGGETVI